MVERIIALLKKDTSISGYKIIDSNKSSNEFFFVKKGLDMNRAKDVHIYQVTVYKNFEEDGKKYTGSSTVIIHPTMSDKEIADVIEGAAFAAGLVKNEAYPLPKPYAASIKPSQQLSGDIAGDIMEAAFKADSYNDGWLNLAELFINNKTIRILNSNGVDIRYKGSSFELEFVAEWKAKESSVEQYRFMSSSEFNAQKVTKEIDKYLNMSRERAKAVSTPVIKDVPVLLTGSPVKTFFNYYYDQTNAATIYNHMSTVKQGDSIQGESITGDAVTMSLIPGLKGSTLSSPCDGDGYPLSDVTIIKAGKVDKLWGDVRHCHYLDIEPTGNIANVKVETGSKSIEEMKSKPYLELLSFSDFQMDETTGDFAGEIRLGIYFDGEKTYPITGGSLSGNIHQVQEGMFLSKEIQQENSFLGPQTLQLFNATIAGA